MEETATVDLSRADPALVARVASFLGLSRELLNLALSCKAFGWRRDGGDGGAPGPSLVEEAARRLLSDELRPDDVERGALPRYNDGTATWLSILNGLERLRARDEYDEIARKYDQAWSDFEKDPSSEHGDKLKKCRRALIFAKPPPGSAMEKYGAHEQSSSMSRSSEWRPIMLARRARKERRRQRLAQQAANTQGVSETQNTW